MKPQQFFPLVLLIAFFCAITPYHQASAQSLQATRLILSHGRVDGVRIEGIAAGLNLPARPLPGGTNYPGVDQAADSRPGKHYRNIPGITGRYPTFQTQTTGTPQAGAPPPTVLEVINTQPDPYLVPLAVVVPAASWLPSSFSLLVAEGAGIPRWDWENFVRFGEGNLYATVPIAGTDIVPGTELKDGEHFSAYQANTLLYEAPDIGNLIVDNAIEGGTVALTANRGRLAITIGYANPVETEIEVLSLRELPDGNCEVRLQANLDSAFGNTLVEPLPVAQYTWFRWAVEDNNATLIEDIANTQFAGTQGIEQFRFTLPLGSGYDPSELVSITLVSSSWGPFVTQWQLAPPAPLPANWIGLLPQWPAVVNDAPINVTRPFVAPASALSSVGLDTFHSHGSTLGDTETISEGDCLPPPLRVDKTANPDQLDPPGGQVEYTITVVNTSDHDAVVVEDINDLFAGTVQNLNADCNPPLPVTLQPGQRVICRITRNVTGQANDIIENIVTVSGRYAEGDTPVESAATAEVSFGDAADPGPGGSGPGPGSGNVQNSVVLLLDASGSMRDDNRIDQARNSAQRLIQRELSGSGQTEVALIVFYDCQRIVVEQDFTTDPAPLEAVLQSVQPSGSTPLADAITFAKDYIRRHAGGAQADLVVLTDGKETCGGDPISAAGG